MSTLKERLERLKAGSTIKEEPVEIEERNLRIPAVPENSQPSRIPHLQNDNINQVLSNDPRIKARSHSIYEPLRNQFLNRTLNAQTVIDSVEETGNNVNNLSTQADDAYKRAKSIQANLMNLKKEPVYYAHVPSNIKNSSGDSNFYCSPFVQTDCNTVYSFQANAENVKNVMIDNNPNRDIPYKVQSIGKMIGADLEMIKKSITQEPKKRKISPLPVEQANPEKCVEMQAVKDVVDKGTQTTCNTGDLNFNLSSEELDNLSEEKKLLLLEFMKAFNIRECRKISSIKERLQHRLAKNARNRRVLNQIIAPVPRSYGPPI